MDRKEIGGRAVGVDFGTTKSVLAVLREGRPYVVPDVYGHESTPSLVLVAPDGSLQVGWDALQHPMRYESRHLTIGSVKRLMGKTGETDWGTFRTYPQELSALILAKLRAQAEAVCGERIRHAVVAVPAHFGINQRWATKQAAEIAGVEVWRLINEATAALFAYCHRRNKQEGTAVVFDFGGGTLDVAVVNFGVGIHEVLATAGDDRLGGDDIDQIVTEYVVDWMRKIHGGRFEFDMRQSLVLQEAATRAKIDLSSAMSTRIHIPGFATAGSRSFDVDVALDRGTFESLTKPLRDRACKLVRRALNDAQRNVTDLLFIGGTSRIPSIRTAIEAITTREAARESGLPTNVAEGAALCAGVLVGEVRDLVMLGVVESAYSIGIGRDEAQVIIPRNASLPTRKSEIFTTSFDNQQVVQIRVYEGEAPTASANTFVGQVQLAGLIPAKAGISQIEVTFDIDANGLLTVVAKDLATGREIQAEMVAPFRLDANQLEMLKRKVAQTVAPTGRRPDLSGNKASESGVN